MTYELEKKMAIDNQDFFAEGVFYRYKKEKKFTGFVTKSGTLVVDSKDEKAISTLYQDTDVLMFETYVKRYFCFPDHSLSYISTLVNMEGVKYTEAVKMQNISASKTKPGYKELTENSSDQDFYDYINYIYIKVLKEVNHPAQEITF